MRIDSSHYLHMRKVIVSTLILAGGCVASFSFLAAYGIHVVSSYLPIHTILETFTVVVASLIFSVGWNAYRRELPSNILVIACAFFGVGVLDFSHMLSFTGMPDFITASGPQKAIIFWLSARSLAAVALFSISITRWLPLTNSNSRYAMLGGVLALLALLHWVFLFHDTMLPVFFIPGTGLTQLKINFEYAIISVNILTAFILIIRMRHPLPFNASGIFGAVCAMAISEFFFTRYVDFTDTFNLLGHIYKIISYLFLYFAIFVETIEHPYHQLQSSKNQMKAILDAMPETLLEVGRDGKIYSSHAAQTGLPAPSDRSFQGQFISDILPGEAMESFHAVVKEVDEAGISLGRQVELGNRWYALSASREIFSKEWGPRFIVLMHDITDRKNAEAELRRYKDSLEEQVLQRTADLILARDAAEAANLAKSVFLANMSHELRTPLNAILGFSSLMRKDPLIPEGERQNIDIINRSGEHLLSLINDILEMAKIEAGRLQLEDAPFDLGRMVRDVTELMQVRADEKHLTLVVDQSSAFPRYIVGDEARLRQALINLVGNALKFTQQGGVTIRLGTRNNATSHLLIEVEDTGIGIAPEDRKRIFEPFVQLGHQAESKGTGLGLTITRQFIQLMGGTLELESALGKGSLFRADLPLKEARKEDIDEVYKAETRDVVGLAPGQPEYRILIVEDQQENRMLLTKLLEPVGFQVRTADDGKQGVALFQDWHPHFIWMDRRMPVMDGLEATKTIRGLPGGKDVKIAAVTASAFEEQRSEILDAGADDFVRKPYRANEIYDCLAKNLGVKYVYADSQETSESDVKLTPEMLLVLPQDLRAELQEALRSLDSERIGLVVRKVAPYNETLRKTLHRLVNNFEYDVILKALRT